MSDNTLIPRCGATPVESRQAGGVPGLLPRRGPTQATGGSLSSTCGVRSREQRINATDHQYKKNRHLTILQWNAEGLWGKKEALKQVLERKKVDLACIQETHLTGKNRFMIRGFQCIRLDRESGHKGGIIILVKNDIPFTTEENEVDDGAEMQEINITGDLGMTIHNCYCPPKKPLMLNHMNVPPEGTMIFGDFNSHSPSWGYDDLDSRGEDVENWQIDNKLVLLNLPDDPPTFFSRRWRTTSHPDLAFATDDLAKCTTKTVLDQLGGSDHKPILYQVTIDLQRQKKYIPPRWNYNKANWTKFAQLSDDLTMPINTKSRQLDKTAKKFQEAILEAAKQSIPRGSRNDYLPNWSKELETLHEEVTAARQEVERSPTIENNIALKAKTAKFKKETIAYTRKSWHKKTSQLNMDRDGKKLWKLAKTLNSECETAAPMVLEKNGKTLTNREAANHLIDQFAKVSDVPIDTARRREVKREQRQIRAELKEPMDEIMEKTFTKEELDIGISQLIPNKAPGPDNIPNDLLQHLGTKAKQKLLKLYNKSWKTGIIPQTWKKATMMPLLKQGKPKTKGDSYRPISLTSCVCKLMERIINNRLVWYLETNGHIMDEQSGFRQHRSTEDQLTYISQVIEEGFQEQKHSVVLWVDMEKAFDKAWKDGIILSLLKAKVSHKMLKWIEQYLHQRTGRVKVHGKESRQATFKQGVPRGGVLSPTLFILYMNTLKEVMDPHIKAAMYADDLAIISTEEQLGTAQIRLQTCLRKIEKWTKDWAMNVNATKTTYTIFSLSPKLPNLRLNYEGKQLQREDNPKYLGVFFDPRLTWSKQIEETQKKGIRRTALLKKLAGTTWGAHMSVLKKAYMGYVRPVLEYGIAAWGTAAKSNFAKVEKVQNQNLRIITGGMKSTPINTMETTTGMQAITDRRDNKILTQYAKYQSLESHPMHTLTNNRGRSRLKRSNFIKTARALETNLELPDLKPQGKMEVTNACPPWNRQDLPKISTEIKGVHRKKEMTRSTLRQHTQQMLNENYPSNKWIRAYTDGSAKDAIEKGGGGIYIEWPNGNTTEIEIPTGQYSSNYKAETEALQEAADLLAKSKDTYNHNVVLLSDAKSVLQSLQNPKVTELNPLIKVLLTLGKTAKSVVLQWIPGHCDIFGNDVADELAKKGANFEQIHTGFNYTEAKTAIMAAVQKRWKEIHPQHKAEDAIYSLQRAEQVTIFRLRSGHNCLRHHLYKHLKIGDTAQCSCGAERQDAHHILQECHLLSAQRTATWQGYVPLWAKLYGSPNDLRKTAEFITMAGIKV